MAGKKRQSNKVFDAQSEGMNMPGAPISNVMKDDFGLDIPHESVPLPSRGACYPSDHPLHMKETVDVKPMTAVSYTHLTLPTICSV